MGRFFLYMEITRRVTQGRKPGAQLPKCRGTMSLGPGSCSGGAATSDFSDERKMRFQFLISHERTQSCVVQSGPKAWRAADASQSPIGPEDVGGGRVGIGQSGCSMVKSVQPRESDWADYAQQRLKWGHDITAFQM